MRYVNSTEASSSTTRMDGFLWAALALCVGNPFPSTLRFPHPALAHHRQIDLEYRSLPHLAAHSHTPPVVIHDALHDPQSQPGTFFPFGGDEGFEHVLYDLRRDAGPVVGHQHAHEPVDPIGRGQVTRAQ